MYLFAFLEQDDLDNQSVIAAVAPRNNGLLSKNCALMLQEEDWVKSLL